MVLCRADRVYDANAAPLHACPRMDGIDAVPDLQIGDGSDQTRTVPHRSHLSLPIHKITLIYIRKCGLLNRRRCREIVSEGVQSFAIVDPTSNSYDII